MATRKKKSDPDASGPPANGIPQPTDKQGRLSVLVELRYQPGGSGAMALGTAEGIAGGGFTVDHEFEPVSMGGTGSAEFAAFGTAANETFVLRGTVADEDEMDALRARPEVAGVWRDTPIAPFPGFEEAAPDVTSGGGMAACPIPPCDCSPGTPKGTIADVATYLGVDQVWAAGFRGTGIVVGVLDSGITAQGRPVKDGETSRRIPRVIGGWPADWGTESSKWGNHGNMCATDVLGMAPDAQLYDLRIAGSGGSPGTISRALQAFNWAINQYRTNGTPQVLTNSWGIFQETWDTTYARNPNHPFTRKVVEAINEGILVLFAAGNCGDTCPDGRCDSDVGPGRSIWGANGHPQVMTVGAVNKNEEFIGYSSRGPAALDPNKPDFCSISHFTGYFTSDSGTSAATPILAGAVAILKQSKPSASQAQLKAVLKATAKDIGPTGFDHHSGSGIVQIKAAFDRLHLSIRPTLIGPRCPPRPTMIAPLCPRPTLTGPQCPRPTLVGPLCPRPTLVGPQCPRPTLVGPQCPRPTLVGPQCPRPTVVNCPRPTLVGPQCPRPTLVGCPRPTLVGCPRTTLAACPPRPTIACVGGGQPPFYDPYTEAEWQAAYQAAVDASYEGYYPADPSGYEEEWAAAYDPEMEAYYGGYDYWYDDEQ
jgi:subtilisin family serine protease